MALIPVSKAERKAADAKRIARWEANGCKPGPVPTIDQEMLAFFLSIKQGADDVIVCDNCDAVIKSCFTTPSGSFCNRACAEGSGS